MDLLGFGIILPQLPFFALRFHASPVQLGLLFSLYSICQFLAAPMLGMLSDRFGRKPVLVFSQAGQRDRLRAAWNGDHPRTSACLDGPWPALSGAHHRRHQRWGIFPLPRHTSPMSPPRRAGPGGWVCLVLPLASVSPSDRRWVCWWGRNSAHPALPAFVAAAFSLSAMVMSALWLTESNSHRPRG